MSDSTSLQRYDHPEPPGLPPVSAGAARRAAAAESGGLQIDRYVAALLRYKWLIAIIAILGAAGSLVAARFIAPTYEVQATIWISSETPQGRSTGPIRTGELVNSNAWPDLVRSFTILDPVVREVNLYLTPAAEADVPVFEGFGLAEAFRPGEYALRVDSSQGTWSLAAATGQIVERGAIGDSVGRAVGFRWLPSADLLARSSRTVEFALVTPREASVALRDRLLIQLPKESNLLRVSLLGTQPKREAATLNALIRQFVGTAASLKKRNHFEFARTLEQQLRYAERELREAEIALENFRVGTITLPSEGGPVAGGVEATRDPMLSSFFAQKIERDDIGFQMQVLQRTLREVEAGAMDPSAFWSIPVVQTNAPELRAALDELARKRAELRTARESYTERHPKVLELAGVTRDMEQRAVPVLARAFIDQLDRRAADLDTRIASASQELRSIPTRTIEELRLTRNVEVREQLYTTLKNRYEEARLAEASAIPDVSVLDSAVAPQRPSANTAPRILMLGIVASIGAALALALLLDRFDKRFRYPVQITGDLGLDILGAVPTIRADRRGRHKSEDAAQIVEAFRSIRLAVCHAHGGSGPIVFTVTSPGIGDGKSLISANLAMSFAEAGARTLLIDGDIRRGALHSTLAVPSTPGLIDLLSGNATLAEAMRATAHARLDFVPCGTRQRSGPELLASPAMLRLLAQARTRYDAIIVDSAPLGAGIDAFALGAATGRVVLVFRTGETDRGMAQAKLHLMDRLPVHLLGAVLNDVRAQGVYRYYSYLYGYDVETDREPALASGGVGVAH